MDNIFLLLLRFFTYESYKYMIYYYIYMEYTIYYQY